MWSNHIVDVFLVFLESVRVVPVDCPESFEAMDEGLIGVDVEVGAGPLRSNQTG